MDLGTVSRDVLGLRISGLTQIDSYESSRSSHSVHSRTRAAMPARGTREPALACVAELSHLIVVARTAAADTGACSSW